MMQPGPPGHEPEFTHALIDGAVLVASPVKDA
jgi:hypothetical protein